MYYHTHIEFIQIIVAYSLEAIVCIALAIDSH